MLMWFMAVGRGWEEGGERVGEEGKRGEKEGTGGGHRVGVCRVHSMDPSENQAHYKGLQ